jgi:hypothetical protein
MHIPALVMSNTMLRRTAACGSCRASNIKLFTQPAISLQFLKLLHQQTAAHTPPARPRPWMLLQAAKQQQQQHGVPKCALLTRQQMRQQMTRFWQMYLQPHLLQILCSTRSSSSSC